jgi:hypothetical protein
MLFPGGTKVWDFAGNNKNLTAAAGGFVSGEGLSLSAGSSQYAEINEALVTVMPLTLSLWVRSRDLTIGSQVMCIVSGDTNAEWFSLLTLGTAANDPAALQTNNGGGGTFDEISGGSMTLNKWHLITGVFAATNSRILYLDGAQVASSTSNKSSPAGLDRIALGALRRSSPTGYTTGDLKDARLYNRALSAADVLGLYDPATRYELIYPLGRRTWFLPAGPLIIAPEGIASGEAFGSHVVGGAVVVSPSAIDSAEAFGSHTVTPGAVTIAPSAIGSAEAFGQTLVYIVQDYPSTILATPDLVAYYRLGESSGTVASDSGPNNHDGTYVNSPTLGVSGLLPVGSNTAAQFDGEDYVKITHHSDFNLSSAFSIELWFRWQDSFAIDFLPLIGKPMTDDGNGDNYAVWLENLNNGTARVHVYWGASGHLQATFNVTDNEIYQLTGRRWGRSTSTGQS